MTTGDWLQVVGQVLELAGLGFVMVGISETRRAFTDRPSLVAKAWEPVKLLFRRVFRRPPGVTEGSAASVSSAPTLSASGEVSRVWAASQAEIIQQLTHAVEQHDKGLANLEVRVRKEKADREAERKTDTAAREILRQALEKRIADFAAGGLTLETWGAGLLALGLVLNVVGVMVG